LSSFGHGLYIRYVAPLGPGADFDLAFAATAVTSFSVISSSLNYIDDLAGNSILGHYIEVELHLYLGLCVSPLDVIAVISLYNRVPLSLSDLVSLMCTCRDCQQMLSFVYFFIPHFVCIFLLF
jgi:hypothetical protein